MTMRSLLSTLDSIESKSGLNKCLYLNETTSSIDKVINGSDFMDVVNTFMLMAGLIITFYGNKIVKPVIFTIGATLGAIAGTYGGMSYSNWFSIQCNALYITAGITGLIGASLALSVYRIANALLGASLGSSAGYFVYNLGLNRITLGEFLMHDWMYWICVGLPGLFGAYYCVNKNRELMMYLTPFPGSLMFLYAVDQLLVSNVSGNSVFAELEWKYDNISQWVYAGVWMLMSLIGVAVQKRGYLIASYYGDDTTFIKYDSDSD
jgi:hypothetical protein